MSQPPANSPRRFVVVSFHAHPDDEALLTAGTLARAVADGHRVVLVMATVGESGLAGASLAGDVSLGDRRLDELTASARVIGCSRVVLLGYGDSGMDGTASPDDRPFGSADVEEAALRLAAILHEERADVLTIYDRFGGYGHVDHVQVHHVGVRAAELAGTPVVLEATVDRALLLRVLRLLRAARRLLPGLDLPDADTVYTARADITHAVDIRRTVMTKRQSIEAHTSQATAPSGVRTLNVILRLPGPVYRWAFRHEWFRERGRPATPDKLDDIFASLRADEAAGQT